MIPHETATFKDSIFPLPWIVITLSAIRWLIDEAPSASLPKIKHHLFNSTAVFKKHSTLQWFQTALNSTVVEKHGFLIRSWGYVGFHRRLHDFV